MAREHVAGKLRDAIVGSQEVLMDHLSLREQLNGRTWQIQFAGDSGIRAMRVVTRGVFRLHADRGVLADPRFSVERSTIAVFFSRCDRIVDEPRGVDLPRIL